MNILSCITPKSEVNYINDDASLLKTLQCMHEYNYVAVPIINRTTGKYSGTISAGDILGYIFDNRDLSINDAVGINLNDIKKTREYKSVSVSAGLEPVLDLAQSQNFIPIIDDDESFIGIIKRSDLMAELRKAYEKIEKKK